MTEQEEKENAQPLPDGVLYGGAPSEIRLNKHGFNVYIFILKNTFKCPRYFIFGGATYCVTPDEPQTTVEGYYTISAFVVN